ncbi:MAG TPA: S41 family peptidase [Candidatus Saccharimonadales bacterium]|nr:S41 family peptidase [Candidatus Saccharimonadales bacterium]
MNLKLKKAGVHIWSPRSKRLLRLRNGLILLLVLFVGIGIGDGRISFNSNQSQLQPVAKGLPSSLNYSSVNAVYQALKDNYDGQLTQTQLLNGIKHGLADAANDPYTEYFTAQEAKAFTGELNNSFSGIGAQLSQDSSGNLEIMSPVPGTPADKAGLKPNDIITAINGKSTSGVSVDQAVNEIRGKAGTKVTLQIIRNGSQNLSFTITRANINAPSVTTKILPNNIGYMQISTFADDTSSLAQKDAAQFKADNVKGVILDLRDDPGGLLNAAINVSSLWLKPNQKILDEKRGSQVIESDYAQGGDVLHGIPTVVLINSGSASASEITAGALHDNGQAYLIGQKSFGKGVVQDIVCITGKANPDGTCPADELKVTIASWYRPDGQNINHKGIKPDESVSLSGSDINSGNDTQLNAAETYINSK